MRSALMFRAMQELALEEIENLKRTPINKFTVKKKFNEMTELLEKELKIDHEKYSVIDNSELKELKKEEKELIKLSPDNLVEVLIDVTTTETVKTKVKIKVSERLKQIREKRNAILDDDKTSSLAYYCIFNLLEKIVKKIPSLELDNLIELDAILDSYFNGEFKFVDKTELSR